MKCGDCKATTNLLNPVSACIPGTMLADNSNSTSVWWIKLSRAGVQLRLSIVGVKHHARSPVWKWNFSRRNPRLMLGRLCIFMNPNLNLRDCQLPLVLVWTAVQARLQMSLQIHPAVAVGLTWKTKRQSKRESWHWDITAAQFMRWSRRTNLSKTARSCWISH